MNFQFLLMRHAYSRHNREKDQWRERYNDKSYKQLPEYSTSKFSPTLIDSPEVNIEQCEDVRENHVDFANVALVICSPLRRCLQTCKIVTDGQANLPVIVEPMLCSRLSASWSIGSSALTLQQQYPSFNFQAFQSSPERWMLDQLSHHSDLKPKSIIQKNISVQDHLLDLISKGYSESYQQFFQRTRTLKDRILDILNKYTKPEGQRKKILIIAHSCVLSFLLGSQLNEKGKVKDKISFKHCLPKKYNHSQIFQSNSPQPAL